MPSFRRCSPEGGGACPAPDVHDALIAAALRAHACKAAVIPGRQVVLSKAFRKICEGNGCGNYGQCWMCPPDVGEIAPLMEKARCYPWGLLYQTVGALEDGFDIEGMTARAMEHAQVSARVQREAARLLPGGFLHLSCGGCRLCARCAKRERQPCRHPGQALASLESYGVDVYQTVKDTDLAYVNGPNTVTYFGLLLFGA